MPELFMLSNRLGVIQGWQMAQSQGRIKILYTHAKKGANTYFEYEPSVKADSADLLRPILEAWAEHESGGKTGSKESRSESKHHRARDAIKRPHIQVRLGSNLVLLRLKSVNLEKTRLKIK
jgi:hypothetical protein